MKKKNDYRIIGLLYLNSPFRTLYRRFFRTSVPPRRAREKSGSNTKTPRTITFLYMLFIAEAPQAEEPCPAFRTNLAVGS